MSLIELNGRQIDAKLALRDLERADNEDSLYYFLKNAWPFIDASVWKDGWPIEAIAEHLQAVVDGDIRRLLINVPPRCSKSTLCSVVFPAWAWAQAEKSATSGPQVKFLTSSYANQLVLRDSVKCRRLIESPWYQDLWGDRFKLNSDQNTKSRFSNDQGGERLITSVGAAVTGEGGDIILADDPNAANEAFSEANIEATKEWWDTTMSTRLNDQKTGAYIVIQQRLAEDDLTGHILEKEADSWTHLCLPMHYEPDRSFVTTIGWEDPRTVEGELLWPERFGEDEVKRLERALGPFACNPAEAPVLMADLSMKPIGKIVAGDTIVGFIKREKRAEAAHGRHKLCPAKVLQVHKRRAPVVKITLDSGAVIRCTPDHKWYAKDRGPDREMYMPATLRSRLARVCAPTLPTLSREDERLAGWLSGFFDGEGTVSLGSRDGFDPGSSILFYQGAGRNLPLCEKLEQALDHFGFDYTVREDERKPNKDAPCYGYRAYKLRSHRNSLGLAQRFMHIVQPTKWRDRIINGAFRSNFIQRREKVISIEPDGEDEVYALTTETGNYVVWGLASSNSAGQLEQRPEPKGGGIIKRDWWQLWEDPSFPPMDFILASLDTAYTEKTTNDYSAITVWGVFTTDTKAVAARFIDAEGRPVYMDRSYNEMAPKLMLMHAWAERLEFHALTEKVAATCKALKVDKLIIENKASGISVAQEMRRLYGHEGFAVQLSDPKSLDKVSRLYSVQHLFADGMIHAPDKAWAELVMTQVGQFPHGKHDDLVDCCSMAVRHLRDLGLLVRAAERREEISAMLAYPGGHDTPLYPA